MKSKFEIAVSVYDEILEKVVKTEIDLEHSKKVVITLPHEEQKNLQKLVQDQNQMKDALTKWNSLLRTVEGKILEYQKDQKLDN